PRARVLMSEPIKRAFAYFGATTLLCLVAGAQMIQLARHPERPRWKHGGFGMYSELYSLRHFCRFRDDPNGQFPDAQYQAAVRSFLASGREEEISRLYDDLVRNNVPIDRVIVVRKRLDREGDGSYRIRYVASHEYPTSAKDSP